jgi:hypothetical protein
MPTATAADRVSWQRDRKGSGAVSFQLTNRFKRSRSAGPFQFAISNKFRRTSEPRTIHTGSSNATNKQFIQFRSEVQRARAKNVWNPLTCAYVATTCTNSSRPPKVRPNSRFRMASARAAARRRVAGCPTSGPTPEAADERFKEYEP